MAVFGLASPLALSVVLKASLLLSGSNTSALRLLLVLFLPPSPLTSDGPTVRKVFTALPGYATHLRLVGCWRGLHGM